MARRKQGEVDKLLVHFRGDQFNELLDAIEEEILKQFTQCGAEGHDLIKGKYLLIENLRRRVNGKK